MAVDGTTPQIFSIKAPPNATVDIHTINCSMLNTTAMDDGTFGGINQLTNGIILKFIDGFTKNLALIVNNLGFWEIGFSTEYSTKAPAGKYGFKARRHIPIVNGSVLRVKENSEFQIEIQDDLTGLDFMAMTIDGHVV